MIVSRRRMQPLSLTGRAAIAIDRFRMMGAEGGDLDLAARARMYQILNWQPCHALRFKHRTCSGATTGWRLSEVLGRRCRASEFAYGPPDHVGCASQPRWKIIGLDVQMNWSQRRSAGLLPMTSEEVCTDAARGRQEDRMVTRIRFFSMDMKARCGAPAVSMGRTIG